jgi:hypothetical protein
MKNYTEITSFGPVVFTLGAIFWNEVRGQLDGHGQQKHGGNVIGLLLEGINAA